MKTEEIMTDLITQHELATLSDAELHMLYQVLQQQLAQSAPGSGVRRNCLASLENLRREYNQRRARHYQPGLGL